MSLLPTAYRKRVQMHTRQANDNLLDDLIEFRDELLPVYKQDGEAMQAYKELAEDMGVSEHTARQRVSSLRAFTEIQLKTWFDFGLTLHHLREAGTYHEEPALLLDAAINHSPGDRVMTVDEMIQFALQEKPKPERTARYWGNRVWSVLGGFVKLLTPEKAEELKERVINLISEYVQVEA